MVYNFSGTRFILYAGIRIKQDKSSKDGIIFMSKRISLSLPLLLSITFSPVAYAAGSITLYGIADAGYGYSQYKYSGNGVRARATSSGLRSGYLNSSRFGLKGIEVINTDLSAVFLLEHEFNIADGSAKSGYAFSRKAYLGLESKQWGALTLGRQKSVSDKFNDINTVKSLGKLSRAFGAAGVTRDNLFQYYSPKWAGWQFGIGYAASGAITRGDVVDGGSSDSENFLSVGTLYQNGPLRLSATYDRERGNNKNGLAKDYAVANWAVTGVYDFEVFSLALAYGQDRNGKLKKAGDVGKDVFGAGTNPRGLLDYNNNGFKSHNYFIGLNIPIGAGKLGLAWTRSTSNLASVYKHANPGSSLSASTQNIYAAMYTYPLSKRTKIYGYSAHATGLAYLSGFKATEAGLGLQHRF